jgi:hypothetical protein
MTAIDRDSCLYHVGESMTVPRALAEVIVEYSK